MSSLQKAEELQGFIFILPWIIGFIAFTMGPLLFSLYASFTDYNITSKMNFVGLKNYITMFTKDPLYWTALKNTIYYVVIEVPLKTIIAILLAVMMNQKIYGIKLFRTVFYLPSVLSGVGVYILWMQMFNPTSGLVNTILGFFGIQGPAWLFDPAWSKPAVIIMKLWGAGGTMLLFLAALQGVPQQLYESAEIDGANAIRKFFTITLPMITPAIFFHVVTSLIGAFQIFQEAYVMSQNGDGGPVSSLLFYNLHLWNKAFEVFDMGYASAMAWVLFAIVMVLTVINLTVSKYWVYYEGGEK
ncbi:carbohydrate ABC transporter permease [Caldicellulosiruptoraceae bacterium PP1]